MSLIPEPENFEKLLSKSLNGSHRCSTALYQQQRISKGQTEHYRELEKIVASLPIIEASAELRLLKEHIIEDYTEEDFTTSPGCIDMISSCLTYVDDLIARINSDWPDEVLMCPFDILFIRDLECLRRKISLPK